MDLLKKAVKICFIIFIIVIVLKASVKNERKRNYRKNDKNNFSNKKYNSRVLIVSPITHATDPSVDDLPKVGVIAIIKNKLEKGDY